MRLAIFADKQVGFEILSYIIEDFKHDLVLIVTKSESEISVLGNSHGIPCLDSSDVELEGKFQELNLDLAVLAWWPDIVSSRLTKLAKFGFINTHPSLLPYNKGRNPNFWALVDGNPFGVSIHRVEDKVDSGEILSQKEIIYDWTDNAETLYEKATLEMINLFKDTYPKIRNFNFETIQSTEIDVTRKLRDFVEKSRIDLDEVMCTRDFLNLLRAKTFNGYNGLVFEDEGITYEASILIRRLELGQ